MLSGKWRPFCVGLKRAYQRTCFINTYLTQNTWAIVIHEEPFQLPTPFQYHEIIKIANCVHASSANFIAYKANLMALT